MKPKVLLVNPPVYDFAAYDFWIRPYGLLSVAGRLRGQADFCLFDYMDRLADDNAPPSDRWGRGPFAGERIASPAPLAHIPRYFRRFGLPRERFHSYLQQQGPFDFVLVQTMMTYWYPGVHEVIEDVRRFCPEARIVLGGNYAILCRDHARTLGADLVVDGIDLEPLWSFLGVSGDPQQPALWEVYDRLRTGAVKLADGCPFQCSYCSVPRVYGRFRPRPLERALAELELLAKQGAADVAFYDDALLFDAEHVLKPFLHEALRRGIRVNLHTPNALNARFLTAELADLMVLAGFKTFYLGFESASRRWQQGTGGKVFSEELAAAVEHLFAAGVDPADVTAYQILGHPASDAQELETSMRFVHSLGIRGMLADFAPIPGTPDGEACRQWVDLDEPLLHNKTAFPILRLGFEEVNRLKDLQRKLNRDFGGA
ncbi:MAG: radical SAM protein [Phycisphaerae bacterium]|nr:radical SAM protein [Phycisphaerae bacterium]